MPIMTYLDPAKKLASLRRVGIRNSCQGCCLFLRYYSETRLHSTVPATEGKFSRKAVLRDVAHSQSVYDKVVGLA